MLELKKINRQNVWQVARLKVKRTQVDYVASNIESILEAFATREEGGVAEPFALYDGAALVGFAMIGYGDLPGEENPAISAGNYCLWRLMIDERWQGRGFDFNQVITCDECGRYGRYQVYMTYMVLSLFFIPCFKWNRHYYVQTTCCNALYELDPEIGRRIARGEDVEILPQHLQRVNPQYGYGFGNGSGNTIKRCSNCGYTTTEDFEFCPKCGRRL